MYNRLLTFWMLPVAAFFLVTFAAAANAAPVARTADLTLNLTIRGLPGITLSATGATVMVDDSGGLGNMGQIAVAAGAIILQNRIVIPVTASTAIASLTATTFPNPIHNLSGAFSVGGAGTGVSTAELPCPSPPLASGIACVGQAGLGGVMGLSGTVNVWVGPVRIPVNLAFIQIGVGGNVAAPPLKFDAAPWTLETGAVAFLTTATYMTPSMTTSITITNMFTTTATQMGTTSPAGSRMSLVSPTWADALGNLLPVSTTFTIDFVPEPGKLLMLGAGGALLALLGRKRMRR